MGSSPGWFLHPRSASPGSYLGRCVLPHASSMIAMQQRTSLNIARHHLAHRRSAYLCQQQRLMQLEQRQCNPEQHLQGCGTRAAGTSAGGKCWAVMITGALDCSRATSLDCQPQQGRHALVPVQAVACQPKQGAPWSPRASAHPTRAPPSPPAGLCRRGTGTSLHKGGRDAG